tara:strand:- start:213 stop:683 length:471 start_codon:yes stop_codon:yes gene_type:complete
MTLGNILRERDEQYIANRDDSGTWRILDTWHDALKTVNPEEDIDDENEAVTLLSEGAFISLMKEAGRVGILDNVSDSSGRSSEEIDNVITDYNAAQEKLRGLEREVVEQKDELAKLRAHSNRSQDYYIKEKAMDAVIKLAAMDTIASNNLNSLPKD